jgi:predicted unusual protein kinase regulating ubiquinone biosynthesis (AarF/ABC1/UbiB family)
VHYENLKNSTWPDVSQFSHFETKLLEFLRLLQKIRSERDEAKILDLKFAALKILSEHQVRPAKSRLSVAYRDLFAALATAYSARGESWKASWQLTLANYCDPNGMRAVKKTKIEKHWKEELLQKSRTFSKTKLLRLSGKALEAKSIPNSENSEGFAWEQACAVAQISGNVDPLLLLAQIKENRSNTSKLYYVHLWAFLKSQDARRLPSIETARKFSSEVKLSSCVENLFKCTDLNVSLLDRIDLCGSVVSDSFELIDPEFTVLILACAMKWLVKVKQNEAADALKTLYIEVSETLSGHLHRDCLGILDLRDSQFSSLASGRSARVFVLGVELSLALGLKRMRQLFASGKRAKRISNDETSKIIKLVARQLGELKGPLMKVGQHLSYLGLDLPDEAREMLQTLQANAQPSEWKTVKSEIEKSLGDKIESIFVSFDPEPIGVGSIGQVHRARLKSGEEVAVKVQFPEIREAIEADIRVLRLLLPIGKIFAPRLYDAHLVEELHRMLLGECDYLSEAKWQQHFREKLEKHPVLKVPKVFHHLCTDKVLTMELVEGKNFQQFAAEANQEQLSVAGENLVYFYSKTFVEGFFNSDPQPGNFIFSDHHVYLLDFGSVKKWSPEVARCGLGILSFGLTGDQMRFRKTIDEMGFAVDRKHFNYAAMCDAFLATELGMLRHDRIQRVSVEQIKSGFDKIFGLKSANIRNFRLPSEYLFGFRVSFSYIFMLAQLGANVNSRKATLQALSEFEGVRALSNADRVAGDAGIRSMAHTQRLPMQSAYL